MDTLPRAAHFLNWAPSKRRKQVVKLKNKCVDKKASVSVWILNLSGLLCVSTRLMFLFSLRALPCLLFNLPYTVDKLILYCEIQIKKTNKQQLLSLLGIVSFRQHFSKHAILASSLPSSSTFVFLCKIIKRGVKHKFINIPIKSMKMPLSLQLE